MGIDKYAILEKGSIDTGAYIIDAISNGAIGTWAPVAWVADSTITNGLPRVQTTTTANDPLVAGIVCDGVTAGGTGGNAVDAAGKACRVVLLGRVKVQVLGNSVNIAIGDPLQTSTTAGCAVKASNLPSSYDSTARRNIIGYALQVSSADNDYIVMMVQRNG